MTLEPRVNATWHRHVHELIATAHDRGVVNEVALLEVFGQLADGHALTLDHLIAIFGVAPMFHLVATAPDETARQLVREAMDAMFNPDSQIGLRDWLKAAEALVGPLSLHRGDDVPQDTA